MYRRIERYIYCRTLLLPVVICNVRRLYIWTYVTLFSIGVRRNREKRHFRFVFEDAPFSQIINNKLASVYTLFEYNVCIKNPQHLLKIVVITEFSLSPGLRNFIVKLNRQ
jgi:hypothetical protein